MKSTDDFLKQAGNLFTYTNVPCECYVDRTHDENGMEHFSFKLRQKEGEIKFAYAPVDGLCIIDNAGSVDYNRKPVEELLSLRTERVDELERYIEKYGFFTTVPKDRFAVIEHEILSPILKRFQVLVQMISELTSKNVNCNKLMSCVLKLLMSKPMSAISATEDGGEIKTAVHPFTKMLFSITSIPPREKPIELLDGWNIDTTDTGMKIEDTFTGKTEIWDLDMQSKLDFDMEDMIRLKDNEDGNHVGLALRYLYLNSLSIQENGRKVLDYLYHFSEDISPIFSNGEIDMIKVVKTVNLNRKKEFTDQYKEALIAIGKDVVKCELDMHVKSVHPAYNLKTMSANWAIDNLFAALYLSLFYMRPEYEVYRRCANPNCNCYFKVKTTNNKRQYHDPACQNAAAQMRHRKKKKSESTPDD